MNKVERLVRLAEHYERAGRPDLAKEVDIVIATRFAQQLAPQPSSPGQPMTLEQLRLQLRARQQAAARGGAPSRAQLDNSVFQQDQVAAGLQDTTNVVQTMPNQQRPQAPQPANAAPAVAPVPPTATASARRLHRVAMPISRDEAIGIQEAFGPTTDVYEAWEPEEVMNPNYDDLADELDGSLPTDFQPPKDVAAAVKHHIENLYHRVSGDGHWDEEGWNPFSREQKRDYLRPILERIRDQLGLDVFVSDSGLHKEFRVLPAGQGTDDIEITLMKMFPDKGEHYAAWASDNLLRRARYELDENGMPPKPRLLKGDDYPWVCPECRAAIDQAAMLFESGDMPDDDDPEAALMFAGDNRWLCGGGHCARRERGEVFSHVSDVLVRTAEQLSTPSGYGNVQGFGGPAPQTQSLSPEIKDVPGFWEWFRKELTGGPGKDVDARRRYVQQRSRGWMAPFVAPWAAYDYYKRARQVAPNEYPYLPSEKELHRDDEAEEILTGKKPQGIW